MREKGGSTVAERGLKTSKKAKNGKKSPNGAKKNSKKTATPPQKAGSNVDKPEKPQNFFALRASAGKQVAQKPALGQANQRWDRQVCLSCSLPHLKAANNVRA